MTGILDIDLLLAREARAPVWRDVRRDAQSRRPVLAQWHPTRIGRLNCRRQISDKAEDEPSG